MAIMGEKLEVVCPCCQAKLTVERKTGLVLHSEVKRTTYTLEEALHRERTRREKSDEVFEQAFSNEKRRRDSLEEKFKQALESKDELDEPPPRPWDLD